MAKVTPKTPPEPPRDTGSRPSRLRRTKSRPVLFREYAIALDRTDGHVKLGVVPAQNISRLRVRLDVSFFSDGALGGEAWTPPKGSVIADLHDLARGARTVVALTDIVQSPEGNRFGNGCIQFGWKTADEAISRIALNSICSLHVTLSIGNAEDKIYLDCLCFSWTDFIDTRGIPFLRLLTRDQICSALNEWDDSTKPSHDPGRSDPLLALGHLLIAIGLLAFLALALGALGHLTTGWP